MKIDKDTGAPQFTSLDMGSAGWLYERRKDGSESWVVSIDDLNLWLRNWARKRKKFKPSDRKGE